MDDILDVPKSELQEFEVLSTQKFLILCLCSFGLYEIWWMYKVWRYFKFRDEFNIMPAARAIFAIFFMVSMFNKIQIFSKSYGYSKSFTSVGCFIGFFVCNFISRLPDPYWLFSFLGMFFMLPALGSFNYGIINSGEFKIIDNGKYSLRQLGLVLVGGFFLLAVIVIMYLESQGLF